MGDWPFIKLGELASQESGSIAIGPFGSRMKSDVYTSSGVPVIRGTNISSSRAWKSEWVYVSDDFADQLPNCNVRENDLVFPHRGSIGQVAIIPGDRLRYILSTSLMKFRPDPDKVLPLFLFYYFRSQVGRAEMMRYSSQVGTPGIGQPLTSLRQFQVPIPPREEQEPIAGILATLDDKIELNRRMNETLEAMARAIFKDWFVDFGPTRAKAEGRAPYLAAELWDLFPDALDDEGKPEGWSFAPLMALAEMNPESWSRKNTPEEVEYVDLANTKWGTIEATQRFPWQNAPSRAKRILRPGDTIVGMVRPGNGSFALVNDSGLTGSTGFAVLRPRQPRYRELVFLSATAPENIERLANLADGAAYPAVRPDVVGATEIAFCEDALANGFSALVSLIFDRMACNKRENCTLTQTRDLLLPKLMSGDIRFTEAERTVEAVA